MKKNLCLTEISSTKMNSNIFPFLFPNISTEYVTHLSVTFSAIKGPRYFV